MTFPFPGIFVEISSLCRSVQVCRKCRTVKVRAESDVFIGTEAEKVLDVAVEVVGRIADAPSVMKLLQ